MRRTATKGRAYRRMVHLAIPLLCLAPLPGCTQAAADDLPVEIVPDIGHSGGVTSVAFSPNGRVIVSGSRDGTLKLWEAASGRELRTLWVRGVNVVVFSPDGRTIVSGSDDKTLKLWDATSGRELRTLAGHADSVGAVAFSADGRTIISGSYDKTVRLWDAASGRTVRTLTGHSSGVNSVALSPDGRTALSGSSDKTLRLWDVESGRALRTLAGHGDWVNAVAFSPDGRTVVSGSQDNMLKLWDPASGRALRTLAGHGSFVRTVAFSPDGRTIVSGSSYDRILKLWDAASGRELRSLGLGTSVDAVAFSPDGRTIISGSDDKTLKLWDAASGRELRTLSQRDWVRAVAFSPDGHTIVSAGSETLKLWDTVSGRELRTLSQRGDWVKAVAFSPDGHTIVSGSNKTLKLWDAARGRELRTLAGHTSSVNAVGFSPDGRTIVSGSNDTTLRRWSLAGELLATSIASVDGEWLTITPEGFFDASEKGAQILSAVRGLEAFSIDQFYQSLYRPDLVREKLAGDPKGLVRETATRLDLTKVVASGGAPKVSIVSPAATADSRTEEVTVEAEVADQGGGIGRVEWRVNGLTLGVEERGLGRLDGAAANWPAGSSRPPLTMSRKLSLEPGDNVIEVVAYNARNLIASQPARVTVKWDGSNPVTPPKLHVLTVGVNDYWDSRLRLSYAASDAKSLSDALKRAGGNLYQAVDVIEVLDSDVTIENLDKVFAEVARKVQPRDVFVFFLAGHGKTVDGKYYFLPRDFRYEGEDSIVKKGVDQDRFQAWFARISARKSILLYDTCESGSLTGERVAQRGIERVTALEKMTRTMGRTVLSASTDDAPALEGYKGHGVFTYALLEGMGAADANNNGLIEVTELAGYVDQRVPDLSCETGLVDWVNSSGKSAICGEAIRS